MLQAAHALLPSRLEAEVLLAHVLNVDRCYLYTWPEQLVVADHQAKFHSLLTRRINGEPLAYLMGTKEFWSLPFIVTSDVLIPRPETEHLVEIVLKITAKRNGPLKLLDLGTGSGIIALTLAKERPTWEMIAVDKSPTALAVARQNAKNLAIQHVQFYQSDWFAIFSFPRVVFDMIVANPPYLTVEEFSLAASQLGYEPREALVAGNDGMQALKQIIESASSYLVAEGCLVLEHGFNQGSRVRNLLHSQGFTSIQTFKDWADLDRVTIGYKSS